MEIRYDCVKKNIVVVCIMCICGILLGACGAGNNDWSYELPNDYAIWHVNSRKIVCVKKDTEHSAKNVVENHVIKFCYNDQYVCLQRVDVPEDLSKEIDESDPQYYIINTKNGEVSVSNSKEEFKEKLKLLQVEDFSTWISTKPRPDGATTQGPTQGDGSAK